GRIGIDYYRKDPKVLMAIVECDMIATQPKDAPYHGAQVGSADAGVKVTAVEPSGRGGGDRGGNRGGRDDNEEDGAEASGEAAKKTPDTPAKAAGLQKDDIVLAIGDARVNSTEEFERE